MDLYLLDKSFNTVDVIEGYESAIWTERYDSHSDCLLVYSLKKKRPSDFPKDYYLMLRGSDELMIIKSAEVTFDPDKGRVLEVMARGLTTILEQRIVWNQTNIDSMLEPAVKKLLDENIIAASVTARRVTNLSFAYAGSSVPNIYSVEAQYHGQKLYKAISELCTSFDVGFKITNPTRGQFVFQLYGGYNRSYEQNALSHVVFSPEFDNLNNARYFTSKDPYCNVVLVGGEGQGSDKKFRPVSRPGVNISGIERYEDYHSAESLSSNNNAITAAKYNAYLDQQGREFLTEHEEENVFDGETDPSVDSGYGVDFLLGDIVQIDDDDLISSPARIVEYIRSDDASDGTRSFPALRIKE